METLGDQFHIPEHLALAAHLYAYYSKHSNANPNAFLFELDDERLLLVASELMMDELPPDCYPESKATQDLIREVKKRALQLELSSLQEQLVLCERAGIDDQQQFMASVQLTSQIIDLKKQLLEFN
jgi:DNA primase